MAAVASLRPEWEAVPYQVKRTAVRDACRAMSNVKKFNKRLAAAKAKGWKLLREKLISVCSGCSWSSQVSSGFGLSCLAS